MFIRAAAQLGREAGAVVVPGLLGGHVRPRALATAGAAGHQQAELDEAQLRFGVPPHPKRGGDLAGLEVSEQIRAPNSAALQVGLHSPGDRPGVRSGVDPQDLEVGVATGFGEQVAVADLEVAPGGQPVQGPEEAGGLAVASGAAVREQERPRVGGGQVRGVADPITAPREQVGGEADPPAGWQRSDPAGERVVVLNILRTRVPYSVGRITVRAKTRHALPVRRSKPQLHRVTAEQFGVRCEDGGGDPAGLGAGDGGPVRGEEADPAGGVVGSEADDHREACEDPHGLAARPIRDLNPELGEQIGRAAAQVDGDPGDDPVDQRGDHAPGGGGSSGAADPAVEPAQVGEDRRCGDRPGLRQEDPARDDAADRVGPGWWALPDRARTPTTV